MDLIGPMPKKTGPNITGNIVNITLRLRTNIWDTLYYLAMERIASVAEQCLIRGGVYSEAELSYLTRDTGENIEEFEYHAITLVSRTAWSIR